MAQILSNAHIDLVINRAHRIIGLADDDQPYDTDDGSDLYTMTRSKNDGGLYAQSNNKQGGTLTIRLQPTSPSAQWLINQRQLIKRADQENLRHPIYTITLDDAVQGRHSTFEGCLLQKCPDQITPGKTFEVMFECEVIVTNNDGAAFSPPLTTAPATATATAGT